MRTIQFYIARMYLVNVLAILMLLYGFVVSIDIVTNLGEFAEGASQHLAGGSESPSAFRQLLATALAIVDIWSPRLLQLYNYLIGVVLVAAMGFTCAQLVKHREFVAMLASGISLFRVARPLIAVSAVFLGFQVINQELIVPRLAPLLTREASDAGRRDVESFAVRLAPDDAGRLFSASRFEEESAKDAADTGTVLGVTVMQEVYVLERAEGGPITRTITADRAVWDGAGWVLTGGVARAELRPGQASGDEPLAEPVERIDTTLSPERIKVRHLQGFAGNLSFTDLTGMLAGGHMDPRAAEWLDRIRWGRLAAIASNLITLIAAMPFFLVRLPQPMLSSSLKAAPIALAGLVASVASTSVPIDGLPVWLGVFVPPLLLMPLAVYLFTSIRT